MDFEHKCKTEKEEGASVIEAKLEVQKWINTIDKLEVIKSEKEFFKLYIKV